MNSYSASDLAHYTGATKSHVTHWTKSGVVVADILETSGTGYHRAFSFRGIVETKIATELHRYGATVAKMRQVIDFARQVLSGREHAGNTEPKAAEKLERITALLDPKKRAAGTHARLRLIWSPSLPPVLFSEIQAIEEPSFLVIVLNRIIRDVERATGDSWPVEELRALDAAKGVHVTPVAKVPRKRGRR